MNLDNSLFRLGMSVLLLAVASTVVSAQNVGKGYLIKQTIIGNDTITSHIEGFVIDSITQEAIANVVVSFSSTRGEGLTTTTDSTGFFRINQLSGNSGIKIRCDAGQEYCSREWYLSTEGLTEPLELRTVFKLIKIK